jgi:PEP-CTERM motif
MKSLWTATALAGFVTLAAVPADATVLMMVGGTTITDNGAGDADPALGQIVNIAAPPGFTATINVGTTTSLPSMDLSSADITSTAAASLVVKLTETGLTNPAGLASWLTQFSGNWNGGSASVRLQTYIDTGNNPFGTGTALADLTGTSTPFALSSFVSAGGGSPFSITEVLTISAGAAGEHFSLDGSLTDAPEPTSIGLIGVALAGLGLVRRRKSKV